MNLIKEFYKEERCPYCGKCFRISEIESHKRYCLLNSGKIIKKQDKSESE